MTRMTSEYEQFLKDLEIRAEVEHLREKNIKDEWIIILLMETFGITFDKAKSFVE